MATKEPISPDATLADVRHTLLEPERHVATVLGTMSPCRKEHGNAHVRIGITGEGKVPYHKVAYLDESGNEQLYAAFDGKNKNEEYIVHEKTWSTKSMSFAEVQSLLGDIRGFTPFKSEMQ